MNIRWYVISTGISAVDLLIEAVIGEIAVNNTTKASSLLARPWASRDFGEEAIESSLVV